VHNLVQKCQKRDTDKVVVTAALNGVFTDPKKFSIPVTPTEMAIAAEEVVLYYSR